MPLQIESRQERSITVIRVTGPILSKEEAQELESTVALLIQEGNRQILLDVSQVEAVDASGVDTLCRLQSEAREAGGDLKLAGPRYSVVAMLALCDSADRFPYYTDSGHALNAFEQKDGTAGTRHFDILQFVKEQEREAEAKGQPFGTAPEPA